MELGYFRHGQVTPARRPFDTNGDDRVLRDPHRLESRVPGTEQRLRVAMFRSVGQNIGVSSQHNPAKQGPIFVVAIDHNCDHRVLGDILHALQRGVGPSFRLIVDCDVKRPLRYYEAHWHDMGDCATVSSGEMSDSSMGQKSALSVRQHARLTYHVAMSHGGEPHLCSSWKSGSSSP